jgi:hypothetical protein
MNATLEFDPTQFSKEVLRLILAASQRWECTPQDALNRLLDELAAQAGFIPGELQPA